MKTAISHYLGVSHDTIYKWIEKMNMPAHRVGKLMSSFWSIVGLLRVRQKEEIKRRKSMTPDDLCLELKGDFLKYVAKSVDPGGWYKGFWARDSMHVVRGLIALEEYEKAKEIVEELSNYQLREELVKDYKIKRGRGSRSFGYKAKEVDIGFVIRNKGAIPTSIYPNRIIEIYSMNPDIDSTALWIIEACECALHTNDLNFAKRNYDKISSAFAWLKSKDVDGDFLLEQGENEDQTDCLRRKGKVASSQAFWFEAVNKLSGLEELLNHKEIALELKELYQKIKKAINKKLWLEAKGYYVDYIEEPSDKLNQDASLIIAFGIAPNDRARIMLDNMEKVLWTEHGALNVFPPYNETGPLPLEPGTYLNSAIWPWTCGYEISARFAVGDVEKANKLLKRVLPYYPYEWVSPKGELCGAYPFITSMGSLLNAIWV